jgi:hypothetical protein
MTRTSLLLQSLCLALLTLQACSRPATSDTPAPAANAPANASAGANAAPAGAPIKVDAKQVVVYREPGRYGGWPANHGIWIWGNEILVGFSADYYKLLDPDRHPVDRQREEEHALARSLDGGETWTIEKPKSLTPPPTPGHMAGIPTAKDGQPVTPLKTPIDFSDPNLALTFRMGDANGGPSWFYVSTDRGHAWKGPYDFPMLGQRGVAARSDYLIDGPRDLTLLATASRATDNKESRVFAARTADGGVSWTFLSWVGPEPEGDGWNIMPATVRLSSDTLVTALRTTNGKQADGGKQMHWLDVYSSQDNAKSWTLTSSRVADTGRGNPPSLLHLQDGRLCLIYGYRGKPFSMRARLSSDSGRTWSPEVTLREDGVDWDLGYPRSVQRPDGKIVTVYYFNDSSAPERFIGATIWSPPAP